MNIKFLIWRNQQFLIYVLLHFYCKSTVYGRFPDGYIPGWFFPRKDVSRKDDSRMVTFPESRFPGGHFPGWDVSRKDFVNGRPNI